MQEARIIPDDPQVIIDAVNFFRRTFTYVFTTGGIGPTHDDITADCIAEAFNVELPHHPEAKSLLLEYFTERQIEPNADRMRMARIPLGAELISNPVSTAPGFVMENVHVMAGVPRIMQAMLANVLPTLASGPVMLSSTVKCNLGEGSVAAGLRDLQDQYPTVQLGSYPGMSDGNFRLSLVARSTDASLQAQVVEALQGLIRACGGEVVDVQKESDSKT